MTTEPAEPAESARNADLVRRCIGAMLAADWQTVADSYAADAILVDPLLPDPVRGRDAIVALYQQCREHEPDMDGEILSLLAGGDKVAVEFRTSGTIQKPFPNMPETIVGKRVEIPEVNIIQLQQGQIVSNVVYADTGALMRQLDLLAT